MLASSTISSVGAALSGGAVCFDLKVFVKFGGNLAADLFFFAVCESVEESKTPKPSKSAEPCKTAPSSGCKS